MWLDDLPPLPLSPPDVCAVSLINSGGNGNCIGITDDVIEMDDAFIGMEDDVIIDDRYHSMVSIEANGDVKVIRQKIL